jgi:hypothetical protein
MSSLNLWTFGNRYYNHLQGLSTEANSFVREGVKWALIYWPKAVLKDREVRLEEMNLKC